MAPILPNRVAGAAVMSQAALNRVIHSLILSCLKSDFGNGCMKKKISVRS